MNLSGKKILITGDRGFLGGHVKFAFSYAGAVVQTLEKRYDLREKSHCELGLLLNKPDVVVHLAASLGGIGANAANPGKYFYDNIVMGAHLMEAAREIGVPKFVQVGTSCSYPANAPSPAKETDLWTGPVNPITGPYGIAKLALTTMAQAYRQQYGLNAITLIPVNLYGLGDHFDSEKSHVIPAVIKNVWEAKNKGTPLTVWGSGQATREFLHVADAAAAIVLATEKYDEPEPVNLGSGEEILIWDLVHMIAEIMEYTGVIIWDKSKPEGQMRRCFDVSKAKQKFGFEATVPLREGLTRTVEWFYDEIADRGLNNA